MTMHCTKRIQPARGWCATVNSLNTLIHQSNPLNPPHPHSPQPTHRLTRPHLSNPLCKTNAFYILLYIIEGIGKTHPHTTEHLFNCTHLYTSSNILDLWMSPGSVVPLLARWRKDAWQGYLNFLGCRTPPQLHTGVVGRRQHDDAVMRVG